MNMARIDLRGADLSASRLRTALPRGGVDVDAVVPKVRPIVDAVADRGAEAALEFGESFDGVRPGAGTRACRRTAGCPRPAAARRPHRPRGGDRAHPCRARRSAAHRYHDHACARRHGHRRWVPVERVGLYVPGGNAVYPSSVVMNVVPAQIAGVDSLVIASPPQAQFGGLPHPTILAAARLLGVDEVWAVGGAQAVALLAYGGTDTDGAELAPVDMVTGPGNIYVTAAKRICRSQIGIDAEAGPTEIAILADHTADPVHVAADLISQAEHDEMAASVLVTPSTVLADATDRELAIQLETTVHRERVTAALSGGSRRSCSSTTSTPASRPSTPTPPSTSRSRPPMRAMVASRSVRPEPFSSEPTRLSASAITARAPTMCCPRRDVPGTPAACRCRRSCAASTSSTTTEAALKDVAGYVITLADAENLPAHGEAVRRRFET